MEESREAIQAKDPRVPQLGTRVVLWSPHQTHRFVVGNPNELRLYEWDHQKGELKHVSLRADMQPMKCFAWSPHSVYEDLFAIGTSGGTIELCRAGQGQPVSPTTTTSQSVHSTVVLNIQTKQRRACNDLAFCPLNANLLATTHDKNRSDCNLLVWDLTRSAPTFQASAIDDAYEHSVLARSGGARGQQIPRPSMQRSTSSASTVITPGRLGILDARNREPSTAGNAHPSKRTTSDGSPNYIVPLSPSETVKHVTFLPHNPNLLVAAVSGTTIRLFDQRTPHHIAEAMTTASLGLCCDPITGDRFGGFNSSVVQIWDHRRLADPLFSFSEEDAGLNLYAPKAPEVVNSDPARNQCIGIEFCKSRRGLVGTLTKAGDYVRLWDIIDGARTIDDLLERDPGFEMPNKVHWSASPYNHSEGPNTLSDDDRRSRDTLREHAPFLADTRSTKRLLPKATSFSFVPRSAAPTSAPHIIAVSDAGDIQLAVIRDAPMHKWSSRGDLTASVGRGFKLYHTHGAIDVPREPWDLHHDNSSPPPSPHIGQDREELISNDISLKPDPNPVGWLSFQKQSAWKGEGLISQQSHLPFSTFHAPGRKYSPASTMRIPLERKGLPSPSMTPKPGLLSLTTEEQPNNGIGYAPVKSPQPPPTVSTILKTTTMTETPKDVSLSVSRQRSSHRGRSDRRTAEAFLGQDISVVMRGRVLQGYGLESARHNSEVLRDESLSRVDLTSMSLSEVWMWLHQANRVLRGDFPRDSPPLHVHGFDFTMKGVLQIIEGFPPLVPLSSANPANGVPQQHPARRFRGNIFASLQESDRHFGEYHAALDWVLHRKFAGRLEYISLPHSSKKAMERRLALSLVGWGHSDNELQLLIGNWEKEGLSAKAACWAMFMNYSERAIDILGRSKDERYRILSGTVAGLAFQKDSGEPQIVNWRARCQTITTRLDDPHARMLVTWLSTQDWLETIQGEPIPLPEKLAIALRFFGDSELLRFINKLIREAKQHGELHGLMLTGINEDAIEILQAYVDNTGDTQTAAMMSALAPQLYIRELYPRGHERNQTRTRSISTSTDRSTDDGSTSSTGDLSPAYDAHSETVRHVIQEWIDVYRDLLDRWRLFHHRSQFDIERGELVALIMSPRQPEIVDEDGGPLGSTTSGIMPPSEWAPRHLEVVCQSCQQPIGWRGPKAGSMSLAQVTACPNPECGKRFPRCAVCRMHLTCPTDPPSMLARSTLLRDTFDESFMWCQNCRHGGHASHVLAWFYKHEDGFGRAHDTCPVEQCDCRCAE